MNSLMSRYWAKRDQAKHEKGFTLIELLVVVVILGVLIAIAIPLYLNYRKGANDASAESDMRNAVNVLEQCNTDYGSYPSVAFLVPAGGVVGGTDVKCASKTINLSGGTIMNYAVAAGGTAGTGYVITDQNTNGSSKVFCYDSTKGGQVSATPVTAMAATKCG